MSLQINGEGRKTLRTAGLQHPPAFRPAGQEAQVLQLAQGRRHVQSDGTFLRTAGLLHPPAFRPGGRESQVLGRAQGRRHVQSLKTSVRT